MKNKYTLRELYEILSIGKQFAKDYQKQFPENGKVKSYCSFLIHMNWIWAFTLAFPILLGIIPILFTPFSKSKALLYLILLLGGWLFLTLIFFIIFKLNAPNDMLNFTKSVKEYMDKQQ